MKTVLTFCFLATLAFGQTARPARTITVGSVELSPGMSKVSVKPTHLFTRAMQC